MYCQHIFPFSGRTQDVPEAPEEAHPVLSLGSVSTTSITVLHCTGRSEAAATAKTIFGYEHRPQWSHALSECPAHQTQDTQALKSGQWISQPNHEAESKPITALTHPSVCSAVLDYWQLHYVLSITSGDQFEMNLTQHIFSQQRLYASFVCF